MIGPNCVRCGSRTQEEMKKTRNGQDDEKGAFIVTLELGIQIRKSHSSLLGSINWKSCIDQNRVSEVLWGSHEGRALNTAICLFCHHGNIAHKLSSHFGRVLR